MGELDLDVVRCRAGGQGLESEAVATVRAVGVGVDGQSWNADRALDLAQVRGRAEVVVRLVSVGGDRVQRCLDDQLVICGRIGMTVHARVIRARNAPVEADALVVGDAG